MDIPVPRVVELVGGAIGERATRHRVAGVGHRRDAGSDGVHVVALAGLQVHIAPALDAVDATGFKQEAVGDRRGPVSRDEALRREAAVIGAVRRRSRRHAIGAPTVCLLVERHAELVLLVHLIRVAHLEDLLVLVQDRLIRRSHVAELVGLVARSR